MNRLPFAAALLALALALPAGAQSGNGSDATGPNVTGSVPDTHMTNSMFADLPTRTEFRNRDLACRLRQAEDAQHDSLQSLFAQADRDPSLAARDPALAAKRQVEALLYGPGAGDGQALGPAATAVADALARRRGGGFVDQAGRTLARLLDGLMRNRGGCSQRRSDYDEAEQWKDAIRAFNDYVRSAPDEVFAREPGELTAIHDALLRVIDTALGRRPVR